MNGDYGADRLSRNRPGRTKFVLHPYRCDGGWLVDATTSSDDVEESKPEPDIFEVVLKRLAIDGEDAIAVGDSPYDAEAAGRAKVRTIGVLCGAFTEHRLRRAGCVEVYPGPAALFASFEQTLLAK